MVASGPQRTFAPQTNLSLDHTRSPLPTLREMSIIEGKLQPFDRSVLANATGINGLVFSNDGFMIFQVRNKKVVIRPNQACSAFSGFLDKVDIENTVSRYAHPTLANVDRVRELLEEVGIRTQEVTGYTFLGITRELHRGGMPELFYAVDVELSKREILERFHRDDEGLVSAVDFGWFARQRPPDVQDAHHNAGPPPLQGLLRKIKQTTGADISIPFLTNLVLWYRNWSPSSVGHSLAAPKERLPFPSKVEAMEQSADRQRDFELFVDSARGETSTPSFKAWAGGERVTLAIVFTDVVGSTALGEEVGDARMNEVRNAHFTQGRKLLERHNGREIKTIGDSFMAAFKSVDSALDFAMALQSRPGHPQIQVRAGIHVGAMQVEGNDVFGGTVNFAARVVGVVKHAEIWLSDRAKEDIAALRAKHHVALEWKRHGEVAMKGFPGTFTLWSLSTTT